VIKYQITQQQAYPYAHPVRRVRSFKLNLSHHATLSNRFALSKEPEVSVLWTRRSHAVKCPRLVILMRCLSHANLMVPIWKRKWERLPNVDGQHSRPSSSSAFKMTPHLSKATNLKANIRLDSIIMPYISDSDGFAWFRRFWGCFPIFIGPPHQHLETSQQTLDFHFNLIRNCTQW
jgi:hypothetical protein